MQAPNRRRGAGAQDAASPLADAIQQEIMAALSPELDSLQEACTAWASMEEAKRDEDRVENRRFRAEIREMLDQSRQHFDEQVRTAAAVA